MTERRIQAVVIGASAGALDALSVILPTLPAQYRLPVIIVVHLPPDKKSILAGLLRDKCKIRVEEAEDKMPITGGTVYFAPPDYHLLAEADNSLSLSSDEAVLFSRPSIDVLFESAADAYGPALMAIVLTGASHDGAAGLQAVIAAGGEAIVEDPEAAYVSIMPAAALAKSPEARVLSLAEIARCLQAIGKP